MAELGKRFKRPVSKIALRLCVHLFGYRLDIDLIPVLATFEAKEPDFYLGEKWNITFLIFSLEYYNTHTEKNNIGFKK